MGISNGTKAMVVGLSLASVGYDCEFSYVGSIKDGREMPFSMATTNEKFKKLEEKVAEVTNIDIKNNEERKAIASHISNTKSTDNPYSFYLNILSKRYLTKNDLTGKTNEEINILKNMIYAYHGYRFNRDDLLQYFSQYSWYNPTTKDASVVYERFSKAEKKRMKQPRKLRWHVLFSKRTVKRNV